MPNIAELRSQYPSLKGMSDYQIVDEYAQQNGVSFETIAMELGVELPNDPGFATSLKNSLYGTAKGFGQLAGDFIPGVGNNNALEMYGREGMERNPVTLMEGDGGAFENLGSNLINRPLNTVGQIAGQAVGLAGPSGALKLGTTAYRGLRGLGALSKTGRGLQSGIDTALFGSSSYGSMRDQQEAQGENTTEDKFKALAAATAIGSVEKFAGLEALMAGRSVAAPTIGKSILKQATGEAAEEIIQTPIERWGANQDVMSMDTLDQAAAGGLAGFVGGGLAGPLVHQFSKKPKQLLSGSNIEEPAEFEPLERLGLPNRPNDTMVAFPDGSTGTKAQVEAYLESVPDDQRVAVRSTLMGFNDLTLPTIPEAVDVEKPNVANDTAPAIPNWGFVNPETQELLPEPKSVVGASKKKGEAYTLVAQARNDGVIDQTQFEEFTNEIATTNKIGRVLPKISSALEALKQPVQEVVPIAAEPAAPPVEQGIDLSAIERQLAPQQKKIFAALVSAVQNNESDQIVSSDGKLQYQAIAERAGLKHRGASQAAINQMVNKVSKLAGIDVKQYLADRAKQVRRVEPAPETLLGMSPAKQGSVVEQGAIFGDDDADASMGMIKSIGATDTDLGSVVSNNTPAQDAIQSQGTEILEQAGAIDRGTVITPEGDLNPSENAIAAAQANAAAKKQYIQQHPEYINALNDWDNETISLSDFTEDEGLDYVADYIETVDSDEFAELTPQQQNRVIEDLQIETAKIIKRRLFNENAQGTTNRGGKIGRRATSNAIAGSLSGVETQADVEGNGGVDSEGTELGNSRAKRAQPNEDSQREIANIAAGDAADGIALASRGRPLSYGETRKGAIGNGFDAFYESGYGAVLLNMAEINVGDYPDDGLFIPRQDGNFEIRVKESVVEENDRYYAAHVIRHELSHALDFKMGWAFSTNSKMAMDFDGQTITPVGPVATEIFELNRKMNGKNRHPFARYFDYPLDISMMSEEDLASLDTFTLQAELFAQIQAAWMEKEGAQAIRTFLPKTAQYLTEVSVYAKSQLQAIDTGADGEPTQRTGRESRGSRGNSSQRNEAAQAAYQTKRAFEKGLASRGGNADYFDRAQSMGSDAFKGLGNFLKELNPRLLTSNQLVEQYGDKIKTLREYVKTQNEMGAFASKLREATHKLLERWGTYAFRNKHQNAALMSVMHDATQAGIHPDLGFNDELNSHLTVTDLDKYDELKARYDVLPAEAKKLYQESKQLLANNWQLRKNIFADVVVAAYEPRIAEAQKAGNDKQVRKLEKERDGEIAQHSKQIKELKGPYFPLMRFGDYIVVAESNELLELRKAMETAEPGEYGKLAEKAAELEKNEKHYVVEAYESRLDMEKRREALNAEGFNTYERKAEAYAGENRPVNAVALDKINDALAEGFDKETAGKLKDLMTSMYISSLPEHHALQRQIKRKGVSGADANMMRAFAEAIERDSFYLSRMRYAKDLAKHLQDMRNETKRMGVDANNVYNNVVDRATADYKYESTPILSALARLSSVFHLGISPAFLLTNMTQPWFITVPQLAGAHGATKTFSAMRSAWVDAARIIKQGKGGTLLNLADVDLSVIQNPQERAMLERLRDVNKLESNQLLDMGALSNGMSPTQMKGWKAFNWATHHIEMVNRISTALATYRLEKARNPNASETTLIDKAINMVDLTQLDYSNENAAYFMKPGVGLGKLNKIVFQFRKYQQGMIYLLARNAKLAFAGDKEALKALSYLMGTQLVFAGTTGLPLTAPLLGLAFAAFGDDDDEEGDYETRIRNYAADVMGPDAARVFWKGLPNALGADLSGNIGMGGLFKPFPMMAAADISNAKTGEEAIKELLFNAAGAPVGMAAKMAEGIIDFQNGEYARGISQMTPRFVASMVKAKDLADNGVSTRSGTQVMGEDQFDGWDVAIKAAGFNPTSLTEHYTAQSAKENTSRAIQDRRNTLLKQYAVAKLRGEDLATIQGDIREFNQEHPKVKLDQSALIKAVQSRKQGTSEMDQAGVRFRKNEESLRDIDRFAY